MPDEPCGCAWTPCLHSLSQPVEPKARTKPSNAQKGSYYKARTKKWLEDRGYVVAHLERMLVVRGRPGLFVKRDQLGADLLAVSTTACLFVQVKMGGPRAHLGLKKARDEFAPFPVPPGAEQWIVVWQPRARVPQVLARGPSTRTAPVPEWTERSLE